MNISFIIIPGIHSLFLFSRRKRKRKKTESKTWGSNAHQTHAGVETASVRLSQHALLAIRVPLSAVPFPHRVLSLPTSLDQETRVSVLMEFAWRWFAPVTDMSCLFLHGWCDAAPPCLQRDKVVPVYVYMSFLRWKVHLRLKVSTAASVCALVHEFNTETKARGFNDITAIKLGEITMVTDAELGLEEVVFRVSDLYQQQVLVRGNQTGWIMTVMLSKDKIRVEQSNLNESIVFIPLNLTHQSL